MAALRAGRWVCAVLRRWEMLHRRGNTIPGPCRGRQSCRFLETGSLSPPLAALRLFPPIVVERNCATLAPPCRAGLAPLRFFLLSPPDPLRWAPAGAPLVLPKKTGRARSKRKTLFVPTFPMEHGESWGMRASSRCVWQKLAGLHPAALDVGDFPAFKPHLVLGVQIWGCLSEGVPPLAPLTLRGLLSRVWRNIALS